MNGATSNTPTKQEGTCCSRRTCFEIICVAIALAGATAYYFIYHKPLISKLAVTCMEPEYFKSSIEISEFIDPSTDPCDDFHQFVCGNFLKTAYSKQVPEPHLPEKNQVERELRALIVEPVSDDDSHPVKMQKNFFQSCLNLDNIEADKDKTLLELIEQIGGWPLLKRQEWNESEFGWMKAMIECKQLGLPFQWFLEFGLHVDNDTNFLKISVPTIAFNSANYLKFMGDIAVGMSGLSGRDETLQVFLFEKDLFKVVEASKDDEITMKTMEELQEMYKKFEWFEFLDNIVEDSEGFTNETVVASNIENYISALDRLLVKTSKRVQANYIVWKTIEYFALYLSSPIRTVHESYVKTNSSRLQFCVDSTKERFHYISETEYIRKYASSDVRQSAQKLTISIWEEFKKRIQEANWMNGKTGQFYFEKFEKTTLDIGGQEAIFDEEFFDNNYLHIGNLSFSSDNIIEMVTERSKSFQESMFGAIGEPGINPEQFSLYPDNVIAGVHFDGFQNRMVVPAAILHGFLFHHDRPAYLNFGSLGSLIGQEFAQGLAYLIANEENITQIWTEEAWQAFEASYLCLEDDPSCILAGTELSVNVSDISGGIVADIIGRDVAYSAYQKWTEANGEDPELDMEYTPNQLFWIKSSLINCHRKLIDDDSELEGQILAKYKNILSVRHSRYFASAFECPAGSPMNPKHNCSIF